MALTDLHKRYGGVRALRGAGLSIARRGTVVALCGENGCGKSTMLKILAGQVRPDLGTVELDGDELDLHSPQAAIRRGIVTVTQETTLAPDLTVAENIYLGRRMRRGVFGINWGRTIDDASALLERLGLDLDANARVGRLRPDQQQMVEIARALSIEARVLILDEPTSSLTDDEVEALLARVRRLREDGVSVVFVSHRLDEVYAVADQLTVLRDGRTVLEAPAADVSRSELISAMTGGDTETITRRRKPETGSQAPRMHISGLTLPGAFSDISLDIRAGEIVGLAGLLGAGRSELLEAIFGIHRTSAGEIHVDGERFHSKGAPDAIHFGIGFVPADRKRQGLLLGMSVRENLVMAKTSARPRMTVPSSRREMPMVDEYMRSLRIKAPSPDIAVTTLSGGNQQKVVVGKWLAIGPRVLLLDEPTRGVDIGAKTELHRLLMEAADSGLAIIVSSSETPELFAICDRIAVMFRGRITAVLDAEEATETAIAHYAGGHR